MLTWSLSGEDSGDFKLFNTGCCAPNRIWLGSGNSVNESVSLQFDQTPDYENPDDADEDNVYNVTIEVTNTDQILGSLYIPVTVDDLNEAGGL